jgi:hypothetical protein
MGDYINRIKDVAATIRLYYIENQTSDKKNMEVGHRGISKE